ncbi:hypothetical protein ZWY2020_004693 [Hordeum vulgare]|nr:hypothetical protein ZWY2020_004693 [Hordeum vulgare]
MATTLPTAAAAAAAATSTVRIFQPTRFHLPRTSPVLAPSRSASRRLSGITCSPGIASVAGKATSPEDAVRIVAVVGDGSISPLKDTPWDEVMRHTADRLKWVDEGFEMLVFTDKSIDHDDLRKELSHCDMLVNVAITGQESVQWLTQNSKNIPNVRTLEGKLVWRRRKYRVKRASIPGTFYFSVLDNGVVSKEFWTVVDVSDDFSWGLFHYHGAAQAAGQSYTGAVLVTPDGSYPDGDNPRLDSALEKCGIKKWELFMVDNCSCTGAPLGTPEGSRLHYQIAPGKEADIMQRIL